MHELHHNTHSAVNNHTVLLENILGKYYHRERKGEEVNLNKVLNKNRYDIRKEMEEKRSKKCKEGRKKTW